MESHLPSRQSQRRLVAMAVQCRTQSGLRDSGELSNISAEGCCVRTRGLCFRVGSRVVLRPEGMEGMTGVVRWVSNDLAGIEFDHALYPPVLDHMVTTYRA